MGYNWTLHISQCILFRNHRNSTGYYSDECARTKLIITIPGLSGWKGEVHAVVTGAGSKTSLQSEVKLAANTTPPARLNSLTEPKFPSDRKSASISI
jgi:hypothetical protein